MNSRLPVGVFDSGVGGLTVLRSIHRALPAENLLYLGDTARVPYGTKSPESVCRYALQASRALVEQGVKALVVACNTASAVALDALRQAYPGLPVIGVIEPGARAACAATRSKGVAVIATESTILGGAYEREVAALDSEIQVYSRACSLFVALAEEGWVEGPLLEQVLARYLDPLLKVDGLPRGDIDCLVLGCTHFPVLNQAIAKVVGEGVTLVDSADTTAQALKEYLMESYGPPPSAAQVGEVRFMVTDGAARFARVAAQFFGRPVRASDVELVDLSISHDPVLAAKLKNI
ncbi:glutamate racemase [Motiliproteus sp. SC1-56]|uniref:glutamate racemase n=1 Tax=Motiliproteus sp. SC1-56 TaxID=2799565 RepID=UPI00351CA17C